MSQNSTWTDGPMVKTDLFNHVIINRRISNIDRFILPQWPEDLHDPLLLPDMERAVIRMWQAIQTNEKIGIVGDYDMDGTPGTVLLAKFLNLFGLEPIIILPTRQEGYGFSSEYVAKLEQSGTGLIVTVDCGIRDYDAALIAKKFGIDVIITDHHECGENLPTALAVINPKRPDSKYPFRNLCGTAVMFKFIQAAIQLAPKNYRDKIPNGWIAWSLDLVLLATIADMVDLVDENRLLAIYGLKVLRKTSRPGLLRLIETIGLDVGRINYHDIAFKIIPKLNACGRLDSMRDVYTLLSTNDAQVIDRAIKQILVYATQSQLLLTSMLDQAKQKIALNNDDSVILLADEKWQPGLTGLVAGRLVELYGKPVGILAGVDGLTYRGSFRSPSNVSLPTLLTEYRDLIDKFGGHEGAAGLTIARKNFDNLHKQISRHRFGADQPKTTVTTDGTIQPSQIDLDILDQLQQLSPWGMAHPEPLWGLNDAQLTNIQWLSGEQHLKATILSNNANPLSVIMFGASDKKALVNHRIDCYGTASPNEFKGRRTAQFLIRDMRLARQ